MRRITFSRTFPSYHPKKNQPTHFVEKILTSLGTDYLEYSYLHSLRDLNEQVGNNPIGSFFHSLDTTALEPKQHTIRAGKRWKAGDKFTPVVWSGKPYRSKQIIIAPEIEIKKVWNFRMKPAFWADECKFYIGRRRVQFSQLVQLAHNDGLETLDMVYWFAGKNVGSSKRKPFSGQIICWNENVNY